MSITATTHLNFRGEARDALEFYRSAFGGELTLVTYSDAHNVQQPSEADQIMWGQLVADNGLHLMAYDAPSSVDFDRGRNSFFVSIRGDSPDEITGYWRSLSDGATVIADLAPAGWSTLYGMLCDRFGIVWVVDVAAVTVDEADAAGA